MSPRLRKPTPPARSTSRTRRLYTRSWRLPARQPFGNLLRRDLEIDLPASTSMAIGSPSSTAAMGPPLAASGATWATMNPCVAPLKRPSVTSATDRTGPRPQWRPSLPASRACPARRADLRSESPPRRPALILPRVTAAMASSSRSKTRAGPRCMLLVVAGHLDHAAFRREDAAQNHQAAGRLQRLVERPDHLLPGRFLRLRGLFARRCARCR